MASKEDDLRTGLLSASDVDADLDADDDGAAAAAAAAESSVPHGMMMDDDPEAAAKSQATSIYVVESREEERVNKSTSHKLRGYYKHKGRSLFPIAYVCTFLIFVMVYVVLNQSTSNEASTPGTGKYKECKSTKVANEFCGCDGWGVKARFSKKDHDSYLSNCFLEFIGAYPLYYAYLILGTIWMILFKPWREPRRDSLKLHSRRQSIANFTRLVCAFCVCLIPDARTIAGMFSFDNNAGPVPGIVILSDTLRTVTWLHVFVILLFTWLREVQIPKFLRHFCIFYMPYRILWLVYIILNDDENDARLFFEVLSVLCSLALGTLLLVGANPKYHLEPQEGVFKDTKRKKALYWPTLSEQWQMLGSTFRRMVAIAVIFTACAEGVVRVLTFQELGRSLVSCNPPVATCSSGSSIPLYHELPVQSDLEKLYPFIFLALSIGFLRMGVRILTAYLLQTVINHLKDELFGKALGCRRHFLITHKGEINQTIHYYLDREFLKTLLMLMPEAIVPIVSIITSVILLFILSWRLSVLLTSMLVFFCMFTVWRNNYTAIYQKRYLDQRDRERHLTMDVFNGFEAVQLYAMEKHERKRLRKVLSETISVARLLYIIDIGGDLIESQLLTSAVILGVAYGTTLVSQGIGNLDATKLAMYGTVAFQATMSIKQVTVFVTTVGKSRTSSDHVMRLLKGPDQANLDALPYPDPEPSLDIAVRNVYFAYERDDPDNIDFKLRGVSTDMPQGKTIGLVGHTGCGKSTLVKLILREYAAEAGEGEVTLGGLDIKDVSPRWLYSKVAYVPQKPIIFDESIFYNLVYGWDAVPESGELTYNDSALLTHLIQAVGLDEFLQMGKEQQVMFEKKAADTSGGQQQRIAIVRALLRRPKLMVLDEITSALDGKTEGMVMSLIREHARANNATVIIIAHRYATIREVDELLVLSRGQIKERGTYKELEAKPNGLFRQLLEAQ